MDMLDQMNDAVRAREVESKAKHESESHRRLGKIISKKNRTSFIGAISAFEEFFGVAWGHGKTDSECTEAELWWRERWIQCRTKILNNGNNQLRAVENELTQYIVNWQRYRTQLTAMPEHSEVA